MLYGLVCAVIIKLTASRRRTEAINARLADALRVAESATRTKTEFLANMSHEIRTPMTAILGYADLILEENVGRGAQEHVEVIKRNGQHLLGLINDILDLSKVEAGKMQIEPVRCSPFALVADVVSLMRVRAAAEHLTLETELAGPLPETVLTDPCASARCWLTWWVMPSSSLTKARSASPPGSAIAAVLSASVST